MVRKVERSKVVISRRGFLQSTMLGVAGSVAAGGLAQVSTDSAGAVKPPRLEPGDTVGLVSPATASFTRMPAEILEESFEAMGLKAVLGSNYFNRRGYFAGSDEERAADINDFFADPDVKGIWARGGWGSARLLPLLDYESIKANPKVFAGYSDATALLNGIHSQTGLVTFHAPAPRQKFSADHFRAIVMEGEAPLLSNPSVIPPDQTVQVSDRIQTLRGGTARGRLLGGNLTVLSAIVGSSYLHDWRGAILFLEDVNEAVYRVDRMITQLSLAGILDQLAGVVFGRCTDCDSGTSFGSLTLEEVLADHFGKLGVPAFMGSMVGHISRQFTLPLGVEAEIDADLGTIRLLEAAVT